MSLVAFSRYQFLLSISVNIRPFHSMELRIERINGMFYPNPFTGFICLLLIPIQSVSMCLPHDQIVLTIPIYILHEDGNACRTQIKFFMQYPFPFYRITRRFQPAIAYYKITPAVAVNVPETQSMSLCGCYHYFNE